MRFIRVVPQYLTKRVNIDLETLEYTIHKTKVNDISQLV